MISIKIALYLPDRWGISALQEIEAALARIGDEPSQLATDVWQLRSRCWGEDLAQQLDRFCYANDFFLIRRCDTGEELTKPNTPPGVLEKLRSLINEKSEG